MRASGAPVPSTTPVFMSRRDGLLRLHGGELFVGDRDRLMNELDKLAADDEPSLVITPNVDHAITLGDSVEYANAYSRAALRLIDGVPLLALGKALGAAEARKFSGSDLIGICAAVAHARGWRIALIGGDRAITEEAVRRLRQAHPHDESTFTCIAMPFLKTPDDECSRFVVEQLRNVVPSLVFVCLGSPKQELWFQAWQNELPAAVYIGAGATLEFVAGVKTRAPVALQRVGLEWLWRLALEPRRLWRRYLLKGPRFIPIILRSLRSGRHYS